MPRRLWQIPVLVCVLYLAHAQSPEPLELRGVVYEVGFNIPLADAQITIYQFDPVRGRIPLINLTTDTHGAFRAQVAKPADYYVEAAKPGYVGSGDSYATPGALPTQAPTTGALVTVNQNHPYEDLRFALMRFGELTGKVVDQDGKPVVGLPVDVTRSLEGQAPGIVQRQFAPRYTTTASDGTFHATKLIPGKYTVRVFTRNTPPRPVTDFSEDDAKAVDEAWQPTYYPGVPDQAAAAAILVNPDAVTDLNPMRVRKEELYRVHLVARGCEPGDQLTLQSRDPNDPGLNLVSAFLPSQNPPILCKDALLTGLRPGAYQVEANTNHASAFLRFDISDHNQTVALILVPNSDIPGRVVTARDVPLPDRQALLGAAAPGNHRIVPDAAGNFTLTDMPCRPTPIQMLQVAKGYYVRELRVNGQPIAGEVADLCTGSRLEIVLDNKVATLNISVTDGDKLATAPIIDVQRQPRSRLDSQRPAPSESPTLQLTDLAPGDYRLLAIKNVTLPDGADAKSFLPQLRERATNVTLAPGETRTISVKLLDPFQ